MQEVRVPGIVSKPPETSDRQMELTSTPVSFSSLFFKIYKFQRVESASVIYVERLIRWSYRRTDTRLVGAILDHRADLVKQKVEVSVSSIP